MPIAPRPLKWYEEGYIEALYKGDFRNTLGAMRDRQSLNDSDLLEFEHYMPYFDCIDLQKNKIKIVIKNSHWIPSELILKNIKHKVDDRIRTEKIQMKVSYAESPEHILALYPDINRPGLNYENNISIRVENIVRIGKEIIIDFQKACYFDQVGSNISCDEPLSGFGTKSPRELDTDMTTKPTRPKLFKDSILANTLGIACIFQTNDGKLMPRFRIKGEKGKRSHAAMSEGGWHCSASGVFEYKDLNLGAAKDSAHSISIEHFSAGMMREIETEASLFHGIDYELVPIAFAREIVRAGKPQLFYIANVKRNFEELMLHLQTSPHNEKWEYDDTRLGSEEFEDLLNAISTSSIRPTGNISYEGWANLKYAKFI